MTLHRTSQLSQVDPRLVSLLTDVGSVRDVLVVQGARSVADELRAMATHHSELKNPLNSKHVIDPSRPLALAVDIAPWPLDWNDTGAFCTLGAFVKSRALELHIPITWGGDWTSFHDYSHYELKGDTI